ncbi:MAG: protein kinase [Acidobacteriota bacterium]|nr:protein kinase [Acidobacteriota bacterium]
MTLNPGFRLGPYEILAPLGAGGMGEVYRAKDSRLGREVAIKVLPESLASDRERLARFEQEARSASALNHPNIVTIYEVGLTDAVSWIAMELIQGSTVRELIAAGPLPTKRLLTLAAQAADALAKAHAAGIVHRDLKPENLMVTKDGFVKILDFGLAKLVEPRDALVTSAATVADVTRPGVVLGTAGYMSPEQASGRAIDFRSDQFSFGSVLYEMLTGKRAFSRGTTVETLTAIIRDHPDPIEVAAPLSPVAIRWIVERCLAKDPEERFLSTRDLALDLANLRDHVAEVSSERFAGPATPRARSRRFGPAVAAASLALAALGVLFVSRGPRERPGPAMKFMVAGPPGTTYAPPEVSRGFSVSPDGTRMVIEAYSKGRRRLFVRPLDSEDATELEGSLDATAHFWSPDSRFIAFYAEGKLKKIPANGGPPVELCGAPFALVGTWNREGTILFSNFNPPGIFRVSDSGGEAVRVVAPDPSRQEGFLIWPHFLPDGRRFLYLANKRSPLADRDLNVASLDSKEVRLVAHTNSRVEYVTPGYLVYVRDGALFAQPFDEAKAQLRGEARLLASNVHYFYGPAHAAFSASQTGVLAYQTPARPLDVAWFDRQGKRTGQLGEPVVVKGLRISPEGKRAAADIEDRRTGTSDVWVTDLSSGVSTRIHSDPVDENMPVWWPDGTKLLYRSDRGGPPDIYEITLGAPGSERPFLEQPAVQQPEDVSRDGRLLVYVSEEQSALSHIWLMPLQGDRKPFPWLASRFHDTSPRFSPDGRWIAFESNESGVPEIYAALAEGAAEKRRISPMGGRLPRWRADGKELYYLAPNGTVMAVAVSPGSNLETGAPAPLFRPEPEFKNYDVTPDGSRFLATVPLEKTPESPLRVIVNWTASLTPER